MSYSTSRFKYSSLLLSSTLFLGASHLSLAGGFQLSDHSITALGRSQAGYGIVGDDASAAHFNPAGMSLLTKKQFQVGAAFIKAKGKFTNTGSTNFNIGEDNDGAQNSVTPNIHFVLPIGEKTHFGLSITSPFGTNTKYSTGFIGRYNGLETKIETININPSFSYQINDKTTIGFGLSYQTFDATLSRRVTPATATNSATIIGDSKKLGYNAGIMFNFDNDARLGISYRSKIDHKIEGTVTFSGLPAGNGTDPATANFTAPETTYIAYTQPLSEKWQLSLGYRWTKWSRFQRLNILFPTAAAATSTTIDAQWTDVKTIAIGTDYKLNKKWALRTGFAIDESPVPDSTRSVRTVDADRTWYSFGATYKSSKNIQFDAAYRYISFDNAPVNQTLPTGSLIGEYNDINVHTLAIQMNYKF